MITRQLSTARAVHLSSLWTLTESRHRRGYMNVRAVQFFAIFSFVATSTVALAAETLKDGETAVISAALSEADATAKVKAYFNSRDDFTVNPDTARIMTDWYSERRCGPGFYRCANRASVRVTTEDGHTVVRVQVFERKREAGINEKPWKENGTSKGKETQELAGAIEAFLSK